MSDDGATLSYAVGTDVREGERLPGMALVVFTTETGIRWLRWLRKGFRHCFVLIQDQEDAWIVYDPLCNISVLSVLHNISEQQITSWYRECGLHVARTFIRHNPPSTFLLRPFTCVEAVKRVLGLHDRWIITPWQLYHYLERARNGSTETLDIGTR
jgi:hypothetical protein